MSNELVIKKTLTDPKMLAQFRLALPAHISPEKFQRAALTAMLSSNGIAECTPASVMSALLKCAQDGLIPDNKEAAIVKYGNVATYMPMVYGLIKRMRNSGEVKSINAHLVYKNDQFDYIIENGVEKFTHKPKFEGDRGELILAYAVVTLDDGTPHVEIMSKEEIEKARKTSKTSGSSSSPWNTWYSEMAKKTVIHRAAKRVPTSADVEKLLDTDMRVTLNGTNDEAEAPTHSLVDSINSAIDMEVSTDTETITPTKGDIFPPDRT